MAFSEERINKGKPLGALYKVAGSGFVGEASSVFSPWQSKGRGMAQCGSVKVLLQIALI